MLRSFEERELAGRSATYVRVTGRPPRRPEGRGSRGGTRLQVCHASPARWRGSPGVWLEITLDEDFSDGYQANTVGPENVALVPTEYYIDVPCPVS
jgi:hypothetical protein